MKTILITSLFAACGSLMAKILSYQSEKMDLFPKLTKINVKTEQLCLIMVAHER